MVFTIKMNSPEDAKRLNEKAFEYDGKLSVSCGATTIDPKSMLALFTLIGKKGVKLVAPDHENPDKFAELVENIG